MKTEEAYGNPRLIASQSEVQEAQNWQVVSEGGWWWAVLWHWALELVGSDANSGYLVSELN